MAKYRSRKQKAIIKRRIFVSCCLLIIIGIIFIIGFTIHSVLKNDNKNSSSSNNSSSVSSQKKEEIKETTASIINTGDIIVHGIQLDGALVKSTGEYDFSAFFKETTPYFKAADLSVANLEVTFGGTESGKYRGYPSFNTPDSLSDVIKNAGLNLLLTSNNHCYDTGLFGLKRTLQVLDQKQLDHTGTRQTEQEPDFVVKDVNGIKIGIANFTYETDGDLAGRKYLNGGIISEEANNLVNSFSYKKLDEFYNTSKTMIEEMKTKKADYIVFYMHWGEEYKLGTNTWQKTIAQKLTDLGVNMIIGGHPHVIEPIEVINSTDGKNKTVCLYSMGNAVSNQRQELMSPECTTGHTEDGMLFTYKLKKTKDGKTSLVGLEVIPTWVNKYKGGSGYQYTIYPLEKENDGAEKYKLDATSAAKSLKSYNRTKAILKDGLASIQNEIGCTVTFN